MTCHDNNLCYYISSMQNTSAKDVGQEVLAMLEDMGKTDLDLVKSQTMLYSHSVSVGDSSMPECSCFAL